MTRNNGVNGNQTDAPQVTVDELVVLLCEACGYEPHEVTSGIPLASLPDFDSLNALKFQLAVLERYSIELGAGDVPSDACLDEIAAMLAQRGGWRPE